MTGVRLAPVVAQRDAVRLAGVPAVGVVGAVRQEAAEHAVLGVEDRQVRVRGRFQPLRPDERREVLHLPRVEVQAGVQAHEAQVEERAGGEDVRGVQGEVAAEGGGVRGALQAFEQAAAAHEEARAERQQELLDVLLAGFQDAGRRDAHLDPGFLHAFHAGFQAVQFEVVEGDAVGITDCP